MDSGLIEGFRQNAGWVTGIGTFLILGGASQCLLAFRAGAFGQALLILLIGLVTLVAGGYMVSQPVAALASITLLLAAYFLVTGVFAIIAGLQIRPVNGWVWVLANGAITLLLGLMLWKQWPLSGAWAVGVLFGVQLISTGAVLLALGSAARGITKH
jgi:uncharacterized membrane protein HdeD (DUF308 family)